jgi:hypothetical protein
MYEVETVRTTPCRNRSLSYQARCRRCTSDEEFSRGLEDHTVNREEQTSSRQRWFSGLGHDERDERKKKMTNEEDSNVRIGMLMRDGREDPVPVGTSELCRCSLGTHKIKPTTSEPIVDYDLLSSRIPSLISKEGRADSPDS